MCPQIDTSLSFQSHMVGWRDVPNWCVLVRIFWDPWSPRWIVPEAQCPYIDTALSFCTDLNILYIAKWWQGCINAGTLCHEGRLIWGPRVPEHLYGYTLFRDVPSPHLTYKYCIIHIMIGMYQSKDNVFLGQLIFGTRGPRNFVGDTSFWDVPSPH